MKTRTFFVLLVVTLAVVAAALFAFQKNRASTAAPDLPDSFFPYLLGKVNDVARITLESSEGKVTVERQDGHWVLPEKSSYPAKFETVKKAIVGLTRLKPLEEKTRNPEFFAKLGVEGVGKPQDGKSEDKAQDGKAGKPVSKQVTLFDKDGNALASLIVGKSNSRSGKPSYYVRRPEEQQAWMVGGDLDLAGQPKGWLDTEILRLDHKRVSAVTLKDPGGEVLDLRKPGPDDATFQVKGIPEGRELKYPTVTNPLGSALEYLNLEDVTKAGEVNSGSTPKGTAEFRTFDGLVVTVSLAEKEGKVWAKFDARYEEPEKPAAGESQEKSSEETAAKEGEPAPPEKKKAPDPEAIRKEASGLHDRLSPWAFQIPQYKADQFTKRMEDLLKKLPEKEPKSEKASPEKKPGNPKAPSESGSPPGDG